MRLRRSAPCLTLSDVEPGGEAHARAASPGCDRDVHWDIHVSNCVGDAAGERDLYAGAGERRSGAHLPAVRLAHADEPARTRQKHVLLETADEQDELRHWERRVFL